MGDAIFVLLLVIIVLLWKSNSQSRKKYDQVIELIGGQNNSTKKDSLENLTNKDVLNIICREIFDIKDCIAQLVSIATIEYPAGRNFHAYVRGDNLARIYADHLECHYNIPQEFALKRARFEVAQFGQDAIIEKVNTDFNTGVGLHIRKEAIAEFFSSGIIEKDINVRLDKTIIPYELFAPLYDLIVKQGYSGEKEFTAELKTYTVEDYNKMVNRGAIITRLEQLGVLLRASDKTWRTFITFRLKSIDRNELKNIIYSGGPSHDDEYFEERFASGDLPRIFDAHDIRLCLKGD